MCEGKISVKECYEAVKSFNPGKTSANDGLSCEFYKYFWNDISDVLIKFYNESYTHGSLTSSPK